MAISTSVISDPTIRDLSDSLRQRDHLIGVEVSPAIIRAGVFSPALHLVGKTKFSTKVERGPEAVIERIAKCIRYAADECDLPLDRIAAIGVGVPGRLDESAGLVAELPELAWEDVPLGVELEKRLSLPVFIGQAFNFGTLGIFSQEAKCGPRSFIALFLGPVIGGGVLRDGQFENLNGLADGGLTFEAPERNIFTSLQHSEFHDFRSRDFRKALRRGNDAVRQFVQQIATESGRIAAQLAMRYSPETIAFGGGMLDEMKNEIMRIAEESFRKTMNLREANMPAFLPSTLGDLAAVTGAATWAAQRNSVKPVIDSYAAMEDR